MQLKNNNVINKSSVDVDNDENLISRVQEYFRANKTSLNDLLSDTLQVT